MLKEPHEQIPPSWSDSANVPEYPMYGDWLDDIHVDIENPGGRNRGARVEDAHRAEDLDRTTRPPS
jgi:hypothetical protein